MSTLVIETKRLTIRPFVAEDLDGFAAIVGDPVVMALVGDNKPLSHDRAAAWLEAAHTVSDRPYRVESLQDRVYV